MARITPHVIETKSKDYIRSIINSYYENGDALFRDLSERDYGIDGLVEFFNNGDPTGKIALIQIKGTESTIKPLKKKNVVSCSISVSNAKYAMQNKIPVFLIYISIKKPSIFYYINIHDAIKEYTKSKFSKQDSITVHIPIENIVTDNLSLFFDSIHAFYD